MKSILISSFALSACFITSHCTPEPDVDYDKKPVILPKDPTEESYFVSSETMINRFSKGGAPLTLKFNYNGSLMQGTRHNTTQATAIAKATKSPALANQQFSYTIKGSSISYNHQESLLNLLSYAGVNSSNFQVKAEETTHAAVVVENTMKNKEKENATTVIMQRL